jgi:cation diffusion facilitator CzcD-associated flavoprotein CzcO
LITERITEITPSGVLTGEGPERPTEVIVLATGFQTHGFVTPMEITGAGGQTLSQAWAGVPRAYYGLSVPGFPNMFLIYGPNTNGGTGSVIYTIEAAIRHVISALGELDRTGARAIAVKRESAEAFDRQLRTALRQTVWHTGCTSWYLDENGNDPNQWPWLWSAYRKRTQKIDPSAYSLLSAPRSPVGAGVG